MIETYQTIRKLKMRMYKVLLLAILTVSFLPIEVVAKTKSEKRTERRVKIINHYFSDPKMRKGIHLIFPIDRTYEVIYYDKVLSRENLFSGMSKLCAKDGLELAIKKDKKETSVVTANDGKQRSAKRIWLKCK